MDKNLKFLYSASEESLRILFDIILRESGGYCNKHESLWALSGFRQNYPYRICRFLPELMKELSLLGGDRVNNFFRGYGPDYSEILRNVTHLCKVGYTKNVSDEQIESSLLETLFKNSLLKVSESGLRALIQGLGHNFYEISSTSKIEILMNMWRSDSVEKRYLLIGLANGITKFFAGRELKEEMGQSLTRIVSLMTIPVMEMSKDLWVLIDRNDSSYRVLVPAVLQIAYIRQMVKSTFSYKDARSCN